ncbi:aspartic peptidase domain-containing protein [Dichotomopilus funicola]|uniref:Probable aspartic-type endopeptidase OPSB n=1 Tax=Dichotomopilus funicola TaxID=1934379 RepID=A0AAN6ZLM7_9PEZI|nr:aspartic peptidase domain-containing protein [Dichotomopilus funicola]
MKTTWFIAITAALVHTICGLSIPTTKENNEPKVLGLETKRRVPRRNPIHRDKLRKRGTFEVGLDNEETLYFINGTIGTPPHAVRLHLDTGSSDLWVNTPASQLCTSGNSPCAYAGTYAANTSSTYQYIASNFNISYVDGSGASGDYVSDTVTIGSQKIDRLQFGVGYSSTNAQGILGIGYPLNEVQVNRARLKPYDNLPAQLVAEGVIRSKAYSLWLNDLDASTGNILFGGVDTEKFTPPLRSLPVESASSVHAEFMLTLTSLHLNDRALGPSPNLAIAVLLDTGSSLTYLPDPLVADLYAAVGAVFNTDANAAYVPCSLARNTTTQLGFTFSEPTIWIGMDELVLDLVTSSGRRPTFSDGTPACLFGIGPAGSAGSGNTFVLGDTFLRSAYVVYDLDNNQIALAPTRFNSTTSNIMEIGTGAGAVPGATKVQNPVRATEGLRGLNAASAAATTGRAGGAKGAFAVAVGLASVVAMLGGML